MFGMPFPVASRIRSSLTLTHATSSVSVNSDTWTVPSVSFGDLVGGATRHLIAVVTCSDNDIADLFTMSVTIGGLPATQVNFDSRRGDTNSGGIGIYILEDDSMTTGTVVATVSGFLGTMDAYGLALYRAVALESATPTSTPTGSSSISLTVPTSGFGLVGAVPTTDTQNIGAFTGAGAVTAFSGTRAGSVMSRITTGTVVHDASAAELFVGAAWAFKN